MIGADQHPKTLLTVLKLSNAKLGLRSHTMAKRVSNQATAAAPVCRVPCVRFGFVEEAVLTEVSARVAKPSMA